MSSIPRLLVGTFALMLAAASHVRGAITAGDPFPPLASAQLGGGTLPSTEDKVVLVDFCASWCAPCKASFAALSRLHADFGGQGLVIIAISVDEKPAAYASFVQRMRAPFPVLLDRRQKLVGVVQVPAMPTSYLIGRDGRVRSVHQGFHGAATETAWRSEIRALLNAKT